jgi:chitodextrinase
MKQLSLKINNQIINDFDTSQVDVTYQLKDIKEYAYRKTSHTKKITVFQTKDTVKVFRDAFNINSNGSFNIERRVPAELLEDGVTILKGYLFIEDISKDAYEVVLSSNDIGLFFATADKMVSDLNFPDGQYQFTINRQNIINYWNAAPPVTGTGIHWCAIDYDGTINNIRDMEQDYPLTPTVCVYELFDKIVKESGYKYEMPSDVLGILKNMVIPYNGSFRPFYRQYQWLRAHFYEASQELGVYPAGAVSAGRPAINYLHGQGDYNHVFHKYNQSFAVPSNGKYYVRVTAKALSLTDNQPQRVAIGLSRPMQGNEVVQIGKIEFSTTGTFTHVEKEIELVKGEECKIEFDYDPTKMILHLDTFFEVRYSEYMYDNTIIDINDILPRNYSQLALLKDVLNIFNLYVENDDLDNEKLIFRTHEQYYTDDVIDWTRKIDSSGMTFTPLNTEMSQVYTFKMKEDEDLMSKDFKDRFNTNIYGKSVFSDSEMASGEETIELNFAPTIVKTLSFATADSDNWDRSASHIAIIRSEDGKREVAPRIGFLNTDSFSLSGKRLFPYDYTNTDYNLISKFITFSPYQTRRMDMTNTLMLSFDTSYTYLRYAGGTYTNKTIYNVYYKEDIESRLYGNFRFLSAKMRLNSFDVKKDMFRKKIFIQDERFGDAYYRLNAIKGYSSSDNLCEVELIKINSYDASYSSGINPIKLIYTEPSEKSKNPDVTENNTMGVFIRYEEVTNTTSTDSTITYKHKVSTDKSIEKDIPVSIREPERSVTFTINIPAYEQFAEVSRTYNRMAEGTGEMIVNPYIIDNNNYDTRQPYTKQFSIPQVHTASNPTDPTGLSLHSGSTSSVYMAWDASTAELGLAGYEVYLNDTLKATMGADAYQYQYTGLSPETSYTFKVRAFDNQSGYSNYSSITWTTYALPLAPPNFRRIGGTTTSVQVGWDASTSAGSSIKEYELYMENTLKGTVSVGSPLEYSFSGNMTSDTEYNFQIRVKTYAGDYSNYSYLTASTNAQTASVPYYLAVDSVTSDSVSLVWDNGSDGDETVTRIVVYQDDVGVLSLPVGTESATVTGLNDNTSYVFKVAKIIDYHDTGTEVEYWCAVPSDVTATTTIGNADAPVLSGYRSANTAYLEWTEPYSEYGIIDYEVSGGNGYYTYIDNATRTAEVTHLAPNTNYYFKVRVRDLNNNYSAYSNTVNIYFTALAAPTGLTVNSVGDNTISVSYNHVEGAAMYEIEHCGLNTCNYDTTSFASFTVDNLSAATEYTIRVRSIDANGTGGAWSSSVTATTTNSTGGDPYAPQPL